MAEPRLTRRARTELEALPGDLRDAVLEALSAIGADPEGAGKPLLGRLRGLWSARVGSYRVIYSIEGTEAVPSVVVRAIRHRAVAYRPRERP
ncbi:MAG: type II toxin-antitoxin system RelE/ParE family toxin [Thermoleophilia bacterium]|nr:type II toxin-antitoxin system RelE/ParE family toxin [Thermoleophilia bacterium]